MTPPKLSSMAWLRQCVLATWILVIAWLSIEWLLPGAISTSVPLFVITFVGLFMTIFCAPLLDKARSRLMTAISFAIPLGLALTGAVLFALRQSAELVTIGTGLAVMLGAVAWVSVLTKKSEE